MFKPYEDDAQKLQELLITSSLFPKYCWAEAEKNPDELRFGTGNPKLTSDVVFTLPETDSSPLKMDGFNTTFLLGFGLFSGAFDLLLVSGRVGLVQKNVTWRVWNLAHCYFRWGTFLGREMWRCEGLVGHAGFHGFRNPAPAHSLFLCFGFYIYIYGCFFNIYIYINMLFSLCLFHF